MTFIQSVACLFIFVVIIQLNAATPTWHTASDGNSYFISDLKTENWLHAQDECARMNLQLAIIDSPEKNAAFDALLRQIFDHSPNLWLGHHDEFNKMQSTSRPFFASSTGNHLSFNNWAPGEPNNQHSAEHCAHIHSATDYKWNDVSCETHDFGFVCEQHHQTKIYNTELEEKRLTAHQKNDQVLADYKITRDDTQNALRHGSIITNGISMDFDNAVDEIMKKSLESVKDIVRQKPYLQAVIADVGDTIGKILKDTQQEVLGASKYAKTAAHDVQMETENSVDKILEQFANTLANNSNEIDTIFQ